MRLIARAAHRLQSAYPHIAYHLFSGNADDVTERLDRGLVDFGVFIEADTVMVLLSQEPDTSLLEALKGSVNGAQVGSLIVNAIEDGRRIGCNL